MKNFSFILLMMLMLVSCSEVEDDSLERITDTIRGKYECKSVSIQGRSLDLNGDGIVSGNMLDEFEKFWSAGDILLRVFPVRQYGEEQVMSVEIPKQDVYYDKRSGEYETPNLYGRTMFIDFMYSVDETGALSIRPGSYNDISSEDDDMIYHVDFRDNSAVWLTMDRKGKIEAMIECTCYDFASGELITVPAIFVYERISYAL